MKKEEKKAFVLHNQSAGREVTWNLAILYTNFAWSSAFFNVILSQ